MTTLVLLPGMDGTGTLFAPFVARLPADIRVQVVSYPAHERLGYGALVELVMQQLARASEPFAVLGESFSGPVAVSVAARSNACALVLACSFVANPRPALTALEPLAAWLPLPRGLLAGPLALALMGRHGTPALRQALASALHAVDPAVLRHRAAAVLGVNVESALAAVRCPVLDLRASEDRVVPASCARSLLRIRPDAAVTALEGPHFLLQTKPDAAAAAVAAFVRGAEGEMRGVNAADRVANLQDGDGTHGRD